MANKTSELKLTLPGFGEFNNSWHTPINDNFQKLDDWAAATNTEIQDARFSKSTLAGFLTIAHFTDGTLKPTEEVSTARNSFVYGHKEGTTAFDLPKLATKRDKEVWQARAGQATLREGIALARSFGVSKIISGSANVNGYPTWGAFLTNKAIVDGSSTPLLFEINGKIARVRTTKEVIISGAAGTYYVYADFLADGEMVHSDTDGTTGLDDESEARIHNDLGTDYTALNVAVGDMLKYTSPASVAGEYLIEEVAPGAVSDELLIVGLFPQPSISSINYQVIDPLGVTLGFAAAETPTANRIYIMEVDFDGSDITAVRPRHFGDSFTGEWRAIDVTSTATFEESWTHNLGSDKLQITIQASQANDGSTPIEELSLATLTDTLGVSGGVGTLGVSIVNSLTFTPSNGTLGLTAGDQSITGTVGGSLGGSITGSVTGAPAPSLTGSIVVSGSVRMKSTRNQVWVKNAVSSIFYKDYAGVPRQTGYVRVIVSKKG